MPQMICGWLPAPSIDRRARLRMTLLSHRLSGPRFALKVASEHAYQRISIRSDNALYSACAVIGSALDPPSSACCPRGAGSRGVRWAAGTRGSPWPAAYVGGARGCPVPAWAPAVSGVRGGPLALAEADSWMILCLHIRSGQQPSPTTLHACPRLEGRPRARHGAGRCSASRASSPGAHVIWRRPVPLDAGKQRPERRSTDGQTILKAASEG
jgi:hypothetical protein